jgi:hypothetical protein
VRTGFWHDSKKNPNGGKIPGRFRACLQALDQVTRRCDQAERQDH